VGLPRRRASAAGAGFKEPGGKEGPVYLKDAEGHESVREVQGFERGLVAGAGVRRPGGVEVQERRSPVTCAKVAGAAEKRRP